MRVSVSHHRPKDEIVQAVDRSFADLFQTPGLPLKLDNQQKTWNGSTMTFALTANLGFFSTPIKGTVQVTDTEVIIDADLGVLERMIPANKARDLIDSKIRGLLQNTH